MNDKEAIAACKAGERVSTEHTSKSFNKTSAECSPHFWRVVACSDEWDVIECNGCGTQQLSKCNFDEDYS